MRVRFATSSLIAAVLALISLAVPTTAFAERTLGLSSGSFRYTVDSPGDVSGDLEIMNDGTEPLQVKVYASNQSFDSSGSVTYTAPTTQDNPLTSPASWIRVYLPPESKSIANTPYLELDVGQKIPVKFDVVVPPGVAPGDHSIILFFEMFDPEKPNDSTASIEGRIGTRVKLRVNGTLVQKLALEPFEVPRYVIGNSVDYRFTVSNQGNIDETMSVGIGALDRNDVVADKRIEATETVFYASTTVIKDGKLTLGQNAFGPYTVRLVGVYGKVGADGQVTPAEIIEERSLFLVPRWVLIAAGALLVVLVVLVGWAAFSAIGRSRRERKRREDADRAVLGQES